MTNKTRAIKEKEIVKKWVVIDAAGVRLGKLANKVVHILMGKHKVIHVDNLDTGDNVIIINAGKIELNQTAIDKKQYFWHTGFPGGIKSKSIVELLAKKPEYVMREAVWGMLPKNRMGRKMLRNMRVFAGPEHNMSAQQPEVITVK
jgi:large subunit ribosomal protein L13